MPFDFNDTSAFSPEQPATPPVKGSVKNVVPSSNDPFSGVPSMQDFFSANSNPNDSLIGGSVFDAKKTERYKESPIYSEYLDPNADNETWAARSQSGWDAISSGFGQFKDNFGTSFRESAYMWGRLGSAVLNMDVSKLVPDEYELMSMSQEQERSQNESPIFMTQDEQGDLMNSKIFGQLVGSLGFTFGTIAEVGTEALLTWGIGSLFKAGAAGATKLAQAGIVAGAEEAAKTGFQLAKEGLQGTKTSVFGSAVNSQAKVFSETAENIVKQSGLKSPTAGRGLYDALTTGATQLPFIGNAVETAQLISKGSKMGLTGKELAKIGYGGFRRTMGEWQSAAGEAAVEAGGTYGEVYNKLYSDYVAQNGKDPSQEELSRMMDLANDAATNGFGTNVAVLGIMNRLQFGNMMSHFVPDTALVRALKDEVADTIAVSGMKGTEKLTQVYSRGMMGRLGLLPQVAKDFGTATAFKELGVGVLRGGIAGTSIMEGLQENIQEGTTMFLKDYYSGLYNNDPRTFGDSFKDAMGAQFTTEGARTFLMGAVTGLFIHPTMRAGTAAADAISTQFTTTKEERQERSKTLAQQVEAMNAILKDPKRVLDESVKNIKQQVANAEQMQEAAGKGDKLNFISGQENALIAAVHTAKRLGKLDVLLGTLGAYGETFTNEEFKEAFGWDPAEAGFTDANQVTRKIASDAKRYSDIYDGYYKKYADYINIGQYVNDPDRRSEMEAGRAALLDAIQTMSFNESKAQDHLTRSGKIASKISRFNSIGQSLGTAFMRITNPEDINEEKKILANEIANLKSSETQDEATAKQIQRKEKELEHLSRYQQLMGYQQTEQGAESFNTAEVRANEQQRKEAATALAAYLQSRNEGAGIRTVVKNEEIEEAMTDILDYVDLDRSAKDYIDANNLLSDPANFMRSHQMYADARAGAHARQVLEHYQALREVSPVFAKFYDDNAELFKELELFAKSPIVNAKNVAYLNEVIDKITAAAKNAEGAYAQLLVDELKNMAGDNPADPAASASKVTPINAIAMSFEGNMKGVLRFINEHYIAENIPGTNRYKVKRVVDASAENPVVTHEFEVEVGRESSLQEELMVFETDLYWEAENNGELNAEPPATTDPVVAERIEIVDTVEAEKVEAIDNEKKKLKYFIGEKLIYKGKVGTLRESADNVEGGRVEVELVTEDTVFIFDSADMMIDDIPGLNVFAEQSEGVTTDTVVVDSTVIEAAFTDDSEQMAIINGVQYEVTRSTKTGEITGLAYYTPTGQRRVGRKGIFAKYIAALNTLPNKIQQALTALPADEAIDLAKRAGDQSVDPNLLERMFNFEMPVAALDKFMDGRSRKTVTPEEVEALRQWSEGVITQLEKLDQSSEEVQNMTEYMYNFLNDLETINFVNNGQQPTPTGKPKSTKRATTRRKKKAVDSTPVDAAPVEPAQAEPVKRRKGKKADINAAVEQLELQFEKKKKAAVRKKKEKTAPVEGTPVSTALPETKFTSTKDSLQNDLLTGIDDFFKLTPAAPLSADTQSQSLQKDSEKSTNISKFEVGGSVFDELNEHLSCKLS